jgi:hypothetical protein
MNQRISVTECVFSFKDYILKIVSFKKVNENLKVKKHIKIYQQVKIFRYNNRIERLKEKSIELFEVFLNNRTISKRYNF